MLTTVMLIILLSVFLARRPRVHHTVTVWLRAPPTCPLAPPAIARYDSSRHTVVAVILPDLCHSWICSMSPARARRWCAAYSRPGTACKHGETSECFRGEADDLPFPGCGITRRRRRPVTSGERQEPRRLTAQQRPSAAVALNEPGRPGRRRGRRPRSRNRPSPGMCRHSTTRDTAWSPTEAPESQDSGSAAHALSAPPRLLSCWMAASSGLTTPGLSPPATAAAGSEADGS